MKPPFQKEAKKLVEEARALSGDSAATLLLYCVILECIANGVLQEDAATWMKDGVESFPMWYPEVLTAFDIAEVPLGPQPTTDDYEQIKRMLNELDKNG